MQATTSAVGAGEADCSHNAKEAGLYSRRDPRQRDDQNQGNTQVQYTHKIMI